MLRSIKALLSGYEAAIKALSGRYQGGIKAFLGAIKALLRQGGRGLQRAPPHRLRARAAGTAFAHTTLTPRTARRRRAHS